MYLQHTNTWAHFHYFCQTAGPVMCQVTWCHKMATVEITWDQIWQRCSFFIHSRHWMYEQRLLNARVLHKCTKYFNKSIYYVLFIPPIILMMFDVWSPRVDYILVGQGNVRWSTVGLAYDERRWRPTPDARTLHADVCSPSSLVTRCGEWRHTICGPIHTIYHASWIMDMSRFCRQIGSDCCWQINGRLGLRIVANHNLHEQEI
jgi:hypothetical protein